MKSDHRSIFQEPGRGRVGRQRDAINRVEKGGGWIRSSTSVGGAVGLNDLKNKETAARGD